MPNPTGQNQSYPFQPEKAYGSVKRETSLERAAPVGSPQALNEPRRARKRGGRRPRQQAQMLPPTPPVTPSQISPDLAKSQVWAEIALHPAASPLVREYAAQAQAGPHA